MAKLVYKHKQLQEIFLRDLKLIGIKTRKKEEEKNINAWKSMKLYIIKEYILIKARWWRWWLLLQWW